MSGKSANFDSFKIEKLIQQLQWPEDAELAQNPLYYHLWGRYQQVPVTVDPKQRYFYRQVLGYELTRDPIAEKRRKTALSAYLLAHQVGGSYSLKFYRLKKDLPDIRCHLWGLRESKPRLKSSGFKNLTTPEGHQLTLHKGSAILARENYEDNPHHIDIEVITKEDRLAHESSQTIASVSARTWTRLVKPCLEEA